MESADRESRRLDILSVKKEANLSAREVGEVEVGNGISNQIKSNQIYMTTQKQNKETDENEKKNSNMYKKQYDNNVLIGISRKGTCSNRCPPKLHLTDLQHLIQSNKKFKDFNFSLKLVTVT